MKILKNFFLLTFPLFAFSTKIDGRKLLADKASSSVTYSMNHPMHSWDGVCKDVNAVVVLNDKTKAIEQVAVALKLDTFNSGNANRDSHALEVMEALKFPKVTFVSKQIKVAADILTVEGNLTFHGITKPVTIIATREDFVNKLVIEGKFDVSLTDFNVERPSLLGLKTNDKMNLKFQVIFVL